MVTGYICNTFGGGHPRIVRFQNWAEIRNTGGEKAPEPRWVQGRLESPKRAILKSRNPRLERV